MKISKFIRYRQALRDQVSLSQILAGCDVGCWTIEFVWERKLN